MADRLVVSHSAVQRIWLNPGIKPHRVDTFKVSTDPAFDDKLIGVVGLYLNGRRRRWCLQPSIDVSVARTRRSA